MKKLKAIAITLTAIGVAVKVGKDKKTFPKMKYFKTETNKAISNTNFSQLEEPLKIFRNSI